MDHPDLVNTIANELVAFDKTSPVFRNYLPGIGPFGEQQLVKEICQRLMLRGANAAKTRTSRDIDLIVDEEWAIEFKIARPFQNNGDAAEHWSQNLLHPYSGNTSSLGDALKLTARTDFPKRCLFVVGYEHDPAEIELEPLISAFELLASRFHLLSRDYPQLRLGPRIQEHRRGLVHPVLKVLRCYSWQLLDSTRLPGDG